jgi:hypothetical protein
LRIKSAPARALAETGPARWRLGVFRLALYRDFLNPSSAALLTAALQTDANAPRALMQIGTGALVNELMLQV